MTIMRRTNHLRDEPIGRVGRSLRPALRPSPSTWPTAMKGMVAAAVVLVCCAGPALLAGSTVAVLGWLGARPLGAVIGVAVVTVVSARLLRNRRRTGSPHGQRDPGGSAP